MTKRDAPVRGPKPPAPSRWWIWVVAAGLAAAVLAVYWPVREHGAIAFDDPAYVTQNRAVAGGVTWEGVRWAFTTFHAHNWHPLTWISIMLDVELFGMDLGLHHLSSVALHAGSGVLLLLFLWRATNALGSAAIVAFLWALHPLRVESVAWLAERKDTLSTFLLLLTLLVWSQALRERGAARARWRWAATAAYALGLLAKPMLVSVPLLLLVLDLWPFGRLGVAREPSRSWRREARRLLLEKAPFFVLAAAVAAGTLLAQERLIKPLDAYPLSDRLVNAVATVWVYLGKLVWPERLAIFYPYDAERWRGAPVWIGLLVGIALTVAFALLRRRLPVLLFGWLWYLVALLPVIGIVQVGLQARADRYTYVPTIGILCAAVFALAEVLATMRRRGAPGGRALTTAAVAAALLATVALAATTRRQLGTWRDSETLYEHAAAVTEGNDWAHYNLAQLALRRGDDAAAARHFAAVLEIVPEHVNALRNLARIEERRGELAEARELLEKAVRLSPGDPYALADLGALALQSGDPATARSLLERSLELRGENPRAAYLLATIELADGDLEGAATRLRWVLARDPAHAGAENALGVALARQGRLEQAIEHFRKALRLDPSYAEARRNLDGARSLLGAAPDR